MDHALLLFLFTCLRVWREWAEAALIIDPDHLATLYFKKHVRLAIPVDISKTQGHWLLITVRTEQSRANIDAHMAALAARPFDDLNESIQIDRQEVTWMAGTVGMSDHRIGLIHPCIYIG